MKLNKSLAIATLGIATLALFPSCQDEDFGYTAQQIKTSKFAQNFENQYGPIDPDQSWDLTNYMTRTAKYDDEALVDYLLQNGGQTRAGDGSSDPIGSLPDNCGLAIDEDGYYHVEPNTIKWLRSFLKEKKNNTNLGSAFSLRSPGNKVAIIPIYQGFANMDWSLWLRRTGTNAGDTQLWTESQNIKVSNDGGSTWSEKGTTYGTSQTVYDLEIKSKPIVIDLQEGENFNLFLKIDNNNNQDTFAKTGTIQLSSMGMMLALPCPIPTNLGTTGGQDNLAMIVGVEDSDLEESDWDMNDVCFLIVGLPNLPNRVDITRKRYMCEDLGNTYDFDFNDIVVDVMEVQTSKYDASKNYFVKDGDPTQIATLKHVCGTLPFQVKVGDTEFKPVSDPTDVEKTNNDLKNGLLEEQLVTLPGTPTTPNGNGWNPEFSMKISGWNHNTNDIEILVSTDANKNIDVLTDAFEGASGPDVVDDANHIYHIKFADRGEAPLIIATDPTLMWMNEHQNIPESWWKEGTFKPTGSADNDAPINPGGEGGNNDWANIPDHLLTPDAEGNVVIWDAADHQDAETDEEKGIFDGWKGIDFQTEFLDALFEGYTIIEFQFGDGNTAETFRLCKVTDNWDTVIATPTISDGKATYTFSAGALNEYNLGVAILNIGDSGKKMVLSKVIMRMPATYTLTVNPGEHGTVSVDVPANSDGKYPEGTVVTVTATPESGWYFYQWNDGNKSRVRQITISGDITLEPSYTEEDPYTQEEGNVELSRQEIALNNWSNSIEINRNDFHEGDVIVIKVKSYGPNAVIGIKADWDAITDNFSPVEGDIAYTLTAANAQAINNKNKLRIQGNDVTISSVTKRCDHITEPDPIQQDINLDEVVNFEITKWSDAAKISAAQLSNIKVGDKLVISLKDVKSGAQMQVSEMSGDWSNKIVSGYDLNGSTSKEIEVTASNIDAIKNGIGIQGHDFTLVKVELVEATTPIDPEDEVTEKVIMNIETQATNDNNVYKYAFSFDDQILKDGYTKLEVTLKETYSSSSWIQICFNGSKWEDLASNSGDYNVLVFDISSKVNTITQDTKTDKELVIQGGASYTIKSIVAVKP